MEPSADAFRSPAIHGVRIGVLEHLVSLYEDDIFLYLTNPKVSLQALVNIQIEYGMAGFSNVSYCAGQLCKDEHITTIIVPLSNLALSYSQRFNLIGRSLHFSVKLNLPE